MSLSCSDDEESLRVCASDEYKDYVYFGHNPTKFVKKILKYY